MAKAPCPERTLETLLPQENAEILRRQGGCKYSQLHLNVKHDHDHEHDCHTTSRHQPTHKGVALCHRVILDSDWRKQVFPSGKLPSRQ